MKNSNIIRVTFLVVLFCFVSVLKSTGQTKTNSHIDKDYNRFKKTFKKEINILPDSGFTKIAQQYHIAPAKLPYWFFNIPEKKADTTFAIGISDPELPVDKRLVQAICRAKGMAALLRNIKIQYLRDVYNVDYLKKNKGDFLSKFEELYHLMSVKDANCFAWDTVFADTTKYGETIVLIKVFPVNHKIKNFNKAGAFNIYCFNVEYQKSEKFELNSKVEIFSDTRSSKSPYGELLYTWNEIGKTATIRSWIDNKEAIVEAGYFKYKSSNETLISDINQSSGGNLIYGLWYAYINTLLKSLQISIQPESLLVQNVDEQYSTKFQDFSREISVMHASFEINEIIIHNNKLFVNLILNQ